MQYIIIPTDFSAAASNAVNYGVNLAKTINATILLLHVYNIPLAATEAAVMIGEAANERMRMDADEKLKELKAQIEKDISGSLVITTELRAGNAVTELAALCSQYKPFAVIMGSTGHSAIGRVLFGSTTLAAIRQLHCPVIAVPPGTRYRDITKIGLACDLKQGTENIPVPFIKQVATALHAELHILHVDFRDPKYAFEKNEQLRKVKFMLSDLNPSFHFIEKSDIEAGINQFAGDNDLDLVITIPKKHSMFDSLFHKSGSRQILFGSKIPVMSIHE